jgi:hypothetical protein
MRKTLVVMSMLFLVALSVDVFAIGNIGTPTAELKAGQWSIGGDYAYSDIDLDTSKWKHTNSSGDPALMMPFEFDDVKTSFYYATLGYGLTDNLEVYGRLGIADIKGRTIWSSTDWGINFDNDIAWGFGAKYTFFQQDKVRWGVTAQMTWIDTSWDRKEIGTAYGDIKRTLDLSAYDLLVAVGPTVDMGGWKLYGGPFFYMLDGDFDYYETWTAEGGGWEKGKADVEEDDCFGGYIGAAIPLTEKIDITFEGVAISGGWGLGTGIAFKF